MDGGTALPMGSAAFLDQVQCFRGFGSATRAITQDGIPYLENEFWTSGQRKAHPLHEVSYRACFKPQLPEFFISRLSEPGSAVLDPFMGRGTTPLQAALMGRRPVGSDISPLSAMLAAPRLDPPDEGEIAARLREVPWETGRAGRQDLLAFYHPATLGALCALRGWLLRRAAEGPLDRADAWIRMVALNRLTGHSPGFFSGRTLPPNQAVSVASQVRINLRLGVSPPERDVPALLLRKTRSLLRAGSPPPHPEAVFLTGPADRLAGLADASVALAVTSPPFLDVVDYAGDNWLRCWFAGVDAGAVPISIHRDVASWQGMVRSSLAGMARVVRPGGHIAFEVGEVRGGRVLLERLVWEAAAGLPLQRLAVMVNMQEFSKTANLWGVSNGTKGTNTNRIVVMRRI
jgi:hypothetical protein